MKSKFEFFTKEERKKLGQCKTNAELQKVMKEILDSPQFKNLPPLDPETEASMEQFANILLGRAFEETAKYQKEKAEGKNPRLPWENNSKDL